MQRKTPIAPKDWEMKAVQLELASIRENVDTVLDFFALAQRSGYNTVVLYLEDRVATPSYPYSVPEESYSPDDIRTMVGRADELGLELIPVVSNLGHTQRFLRHPELLHLAELRGGIAGRFTPAGKPYYIDVCPSLEETYAFFDRYITEVAALFPGRYFHVGLDETWNVGYCELCRARIEAGESIGDIFVQHILRTHKLITSLGKRMMIWEDMFEHFQDKLALLPRDIVLCCWNYRWIGDKLRGHFSDSQQDDLFALYERMGFDYVMSVRPELHNVESFTSYAAKYRPLGGLFTIWNRGTAPLPELYPSIACAGLLWQGIDPDDLHARLSRSLRRELGEHLPESFTDAMESALLIDDRVRTSTPEITFPVTEEKFWREQSCRGLLRQLDREIAAASGQMTQMARDVAEDYRWRVQDVLLGISKRRLDYALMEHRCGIREGGMEAVARGYEADAATVEVRLAQLLEAWEHTRAGISTENLVKKLQTRAATLRGCAETARGAVFGEKACLLVRLFFYEGSGGERLRWTLKFADGGEEKVFEGPCNGDEDFYDVFLTIPALAGKEPVGLRLDAWGYGGIGLTHVEVLAGGRRFKPWAITGLEGRVSDPGHLLCDDSRMCFIGNSHYNWLFARQELTKQVHTLELALREEA